jgi:hypothetical protein
MLLQQSLLEDAWHKACHIAKYAATSDAIHMKFAG